MKILEIDNISYLVKHIITVKTLEEAEKIKILRNCEKIIIDKNTNYFLLCDIIKDVDFIDIIEENKTEETEEIENKKV